jgi:hypothetical protein
MGQAGVLRLLPESLDRRRLCASVWTQISTVLLCDKLADKPVCRSRYVRYL